MATPHKDILKNTRLNRLRESLGVDQTGIAINHFIVVGGYSCLKVYSC